MNAFEGAKQQVHDAAQEMARRQAELRQILTENLEEDPNHYFLHRAQLPGDRWHGFTPEGLWKWYFHGIECDLDHTGDGRTVRLEFLRQGRPGVFTVDGLERFIAHTRSPWQDFPALQKYLGPELAVRLKRLWPLCEALETTGEFIRIEKDAPWFQLARIRISPL